MDYRKPKEKKSENSKYLIFEEWMSIIFHIFVEVLKYSGERVWHVISEL